MYYCNSECLGLCLVLGLCLAVYDGESVNEPSKLSHSVSMFCACSPMQLGDRFYAVSVPCEVKGATFKVSTPPIAPYQQ